jgi:hypothetical protein
MPIQKTVIKELSTEQILLLQKQFKTKIESAASVNNGGLLVSFSKHKMFYYPSLDYVKSRRKLYKQLIKQNFRVVRQTPILHLEVTQKLIDIILPDGIFTKFWHGERKQPSIILKLWHIDNKTHQDAIYSPLLR